MDWATWSGLGVLLFTVAALSRFWWPPLRDSIYRRYLGLRAFICSLTFRWGWTVEAWRQTRGERRNTLLLSFLSLVGAYWIAWMVYPDKPDFSQAQGFMVVFYAIGLATFVGLMLSVYFAFLVLNWVWRGFWGKNFIPAPGVPTVSPMNRVGRASPLGEARWARSDEVDAALGSRERPQVPRKFRD